VQVIVPEERCGKHDDLSWRLQVDYFGLASKEYGQKKEITRPKN
jgi:hypothetical protein